MLPICAAEEKCFSESLSLRVHSSLRSTAQLEQVRRQQLSRAERFQDCDIILYTKKHCALPTTAPWPAIDCQWPSVTGSVACCRPLRVRFATSSNYADFFNISMCVPAACMCHHRFSDESSFQYSLVWLVLTNFSLAKTNRTKVVRVRSVCCNNYNPSHMSVESSYC